MDQQQRRVMHSSNRTDWCTPQHIIDLVNKVNTISLDPCSNAQATVNAAISIAVPDDGLADNISWADLANKNGKGLVYINPPYGRNIMKPWVTRSVREQAKGAEIIMLLPARTETKWFQTWVFPTAKAICFYKGRLKFQGAKHSAPFPSVLVYWGDNVTKFYDAFKDHGHIVCSL